MDYGPRTALVVTDIQNDFVDPSGSLYVQGAESILAIVNAEIRAARDAGAVVLYTQDWHPPETPHFITGGGPWPVHCVAGTWGAEFVAGLVVAGPVLRKGTGGEDGYSGFTVRDPASGETSATELETMLRTHEVEALILVGVATDYCVRETALDALRLGFAVTVVTSAVRAVDRPPGSGEAALGELAAAGASLVP